LRNYIVGSGPFPLFTYHQRDLQLTATILAGHETVVSHDFLRYQVDFRCNYFQSTAMNWTLLELARNLPAQKKLRAEIFAMEDTIRARGTKGAALQ